jgi:hypothetical protein
MKEIREKYRIYSVMTPFAPNETAEGCFPSGGGSGGMGMVLIDAQRLMGHIIARHAGLELQRICLQFSR